MMGNSVKLGLAVALLWVGLGVGAVHDPWTRAAGGGGILLGAPPQAFALGDLSEITAYPLFIRGDANRDSALTVMDGVVILQFLFEGGSYLACPDAADVNDDGDVDVADSIALLNYLFAGGLAPPAPCQCAGPDPTPDLLGCE